MTAQTAYRCTDPSVAEAFQAWKHEYDTHRRRVIDEAAAIGKNTGALMTKTVFGNRIVGLAPDDPNDPPAGWKYMRNKNKLYPDRRTKAGKQAAAWLDSAQPKAHIEFLHQHGMPSDHMNGGQCYTPGAQLVDGELLVNWGCDLPAERVTGPWERIPLSRYYAAIEAAEKAEAAS